MNTAGYRWLFVAVSLGLLPACHPGSGRVDPEAAAAARAGALAPREVRLVKPEAREEHPTLQLVGEVRPFDSVDVSSEVAGKVDLVLAEVGDQVEKGQPLVEVDRQTYRLYLEQAEAELAAARANLALAEKDLERKRDLVSDKTIPQATFDQASASFDLAQARVASAEATRNLAERHWQRSTVRAPAAGSIAKRWVASGQWADVGGRLYELAVGDTVKVVAEVPAEWAAKLSGLEGFDFTLGLATVNRRARLYSIDPVVERASRSFEVIGLADNRDRALRPGMFANITLELPTPVRSLWLPGSAVLSSDIPQIMLAEDGVVVIRNVQTGRRADGLIEILDGLDPDDQVIAEVAGLSRGLPVKIAGQLNEAGS